MRLVALAMLAILTMDCSTAFAVEQCRQIRNRPDRQACYDRQSAARLAKQKTGEPAESVHSKVMIDSVEQMKLEDDKLTKKLQGICRKC